MQTVQTVVDQWLRWLPFGLLPSAHEQGRPEPEIIEMRLPDGQDDWLAAMRDETIETVQVWPIDSVLKNLALRAATWHVRATEHKNGTRTARTTRQELEQWRTSTLSLADRLPFAGQLGQMMKAAAVQLEADLSWPQRFFSRYPSSIETMADAQWRVSINLWAANELLEAVNELEPEYAEHRQREAGASADYIQVPVMKFWPAMFDWCAKADLDPSFVDYRQAVKRVKALETTIKPEMRNALMVNQLQNIFRTGHFGPNDLEQQPHSTIQ